MGGRNAEWNVAVDKRVQSVLSFVGGVMQHHTGADSQCVSTTSELTKKRPVC